MECKGCGKKIKKNDVYSIMEITWKEIGKTAPVLTEEHYICSKCSRQVQIAERLRLAQNKKLCEN